MITNILHNALLASNAKIDKNLNTLTFTAQEAKSTIKLTKIGSPFVDGLEYRTNINRVWSTYTINTEITLTNIGDYVQFQNTNNNQLSVNTNNYVRFIMTGTITAAGNIQSMLNYSTSCSDYCYYSMFRGCSSLTVAPELPATTLATGCYHSMFYDCKNLEFDFETFLKSHKNSTLADYCFAHMVNGCTKVNENRKLIPLSDWKTNYNTNYAESCYDGLYADCKSITQIPENYLTEIVGSTVSFKGLGGFSSWFKNCTNLRDVPTNLLPFTSLTNSCYSNMFAGCKSLRSAPELPATTLAPYCYHSMFADCYLLETAPRLPALTLTKRCYGYMFAECHKLTSTPALPATNLAEECYYNMFGGCTSLTSASKLPATNLAIGCYAHMFSRCYDLVSAPELPATTLADSCYSRMFSSCMDLNYVKVRFTDWPPALTTNSWLNGVSSTGTFVCPADLDTTKRGWSYIPEGWTVELIESNA